MIPLNESLRKLGFALLLTLWGCGGGGNDVPRLDPRLNSLEEVSKNADTLLISRPYFLSRVTTDGETIPREERRTEAITCSGARCSSALEQISIQNLHEVLSLNPDNVTVDSREGFHTLRSTDRMRNNGDGDSTIMLTTTTYGIWGTYGFAAVALNTESLTGTRNGAPVSSTLDGTQAYVMADASGTNPTGTGSATWTGIVEAATTTAFQRLTGTVRLHIPNLAQPRLGVTVNVPNHTIGAPGWADISLTAGRFATGNPGQDRLEGRFAGPRHEKAWGLFDVTGYVGAFGARRR